MSPPPSRMAAPAAARSSYSVTPGLARADHRLHGVLAQHAGLAHAVELLGAVDRQQFVHPAVREHELGVRQPLAQRVVLIDRQVVAVARIDLEQADAAALELQFLEALDHHLGVVAAAAAAHVGERGRGLAPHRLGMGAAHGVDQRRLALERHHHVAAERVPFPMAGEPQHAAAEAPVARSARHDHGSRAFRRASWRATPRSGGRIPAWRTARRPRRGSRACRASC